MTLAYGIAAKDFGKKSKLHFGFLGQEGAMCKFFGAVVIAVISCAVSAQEVPQRRTYQTRGEIQHHATSASVVALAHRPLHQALTAIREEYGWLIDFEDPPYRSRLDFVDETDPQWRAAHPGAKSVRGIAGGYFRSDYPEGPNTAIADTEKERVLRQVVTDYNKSGNPGKFRITKEATDRFAIIGEYAKDDTGRDVLTPSVLDTPISIPTAPRGGLDAVLLILSELSAKTGTQVSLGVFPNNVLIPAKVTVGGSNVSARNLLLQVLAGLRLKLVWSLLSSSDSNRYFFSLSVASRVTYDTFGNRILVPIDH